jgi:hypothetical protein
MPKDLSHEHQPIGQNFSAGKEHSQESSHRLSAAQLQTYQTQGFVSGIPILENSQIDLLKSELNDLLNPNHEGKQFWYEYHSNESGDPQNVLFHALGAWRVKEGLHDLLWSANFLKPASQLLGNRSVRFWHDQLFCKPAHDGGVVAWHQDYSYWTRTRPMQHLTCWIGLDDATEENGCLQYIPGSHLWDLLPITGLSGNMDAIQNVLNEEQWKQFQQPTAIELKAGQASFHHPLLIHGSYANRTAQPRRAIVLNVFAEGTCSDSDEPLLNGVPPIPKGEKMEGQFFPLLYDVTLAEQSKTG